LNSEFEPSERVVRKLKSRDKRGSKSRDNSARTRGVNSAKGSQKNLLGDDQIFNNLVNEIEKEWENNNIPEAQRIPFREAVFSLHVNKALPIISKEIEDLKEHRSSTQIALKAIAAREESLNSIHEMLSYLVEAPKWETMKDVTLECAELLHAHRMLTLNACESIVRWREKLAYALMMHKDALKNPKPIPFLWEGENYLCKMKNDMDFLLESEFAKILKFSEQPDPLLITPSKPKGSSSSSKKKEHNYFLSDGQVVIPLHSALIRRVRLAEMVILEETRNQELGDSYSDINEKLQDYIYRMIMGNGLQTIVEEIVEDEVEEEKQRIKLEREAAAKRKTEEDEKKKQELEDAERRKREAAERKRKEKEEALKFKKEMEELKKKQKEEAARKKNEEEMKKRLELEEKKRKEQEERKRKQEEELKLKKELEDKKRKEEEERFKKSLEIIDSQISDMIYRNLVETVIEETKLDHMADESINKALVTKRKSIQDEEERLKLEQREKELENYKIADMIYNEYLSEFIGLDWLQKVAENILEFERDNEKKRTVPTLNIHPEVAEDNTNEIFTPGIHSPAQYSIGSNEMPNESEESPIPSKKEEEDYKFEFADFEVLENLTSVDFKPVKAYEETMSKILEDYYENIPELQLQVLPQIDILEQELEKGTDPCWYWALSQNKIVGLLAFKFDPSKEDRQLVLVHYSSLSDSAYMMILDKAVEFLWKLDPCQEIRVNLYMTGGIPELPREIKAKYTELKFKWKTQYSIPEFGIKIDVMGKTRPNNLKSSLKIEEPKLSLLNGCLIETTRENLDADEKAVNEMIQVGNRQILLSSILSLFGKLDKGQIKLTDYCKTKLQGDISDVLEIINSTDSFNFPLIENLVSENTQEIQSFFSQKNLKFSATQAKLSGSILDLNLKWVGATHVDHTVNEKVYKFLRFKNKDIKHYKGDDNTEFFRVPTSSPNLQAFFIRYRGMLEELNSELKYFKTDLFYKIEDMLKEMPDAGSFGSELWVPAFNKQVKWEIPWIKGYEIPPQTEEDEVSLYVSRCQEHTLLTQTVSQPHPGILKISPKGKILKDSFIFGLFHTKIDKILEIPLCVCLVQQEDWIAK